MMTLFRKERLEFQNNFSLQGNLEDVLPWMTSLKYLDISMTEISAFLPSIAPYLSGLQVFQAWSLPLEGSIPESLGSWSNLEKLVIGETPLLAGTIPTEIGLLSNLASLEISYVMSMEGTLPTELGLLTKLTTLNLRWTNRQGTLPNEYSKLTNLMILDLSGNRAITGTIPSYYGQMTSLST
jgi:Leucine-rich repeat (LRR) protein